MNFYDEKPLFNDANIEEVKSAPTVFLKGGGKDDGDRFIVSFKLNETLEEHFRSEDGKSVLSICVIKYHEPRPFSTHFVTINNAEVWPKSQNISENFLTTASAERNKITFTLSEEQLRRIARNVPKQGQYAKFEIVNVDGRYGVFRYSNMGFPEIEEFRKSDLSLAAQMFLKK